MAFRIAGVVLLLVLAGSVEIHVPHIPDGTKPLSLAEVAAQLRLKKLFEGGVDATERDPTPVQDITVRVYNDPSDSVTELNRFTLKGNVISEGEPSAENWFVFFCVEWDELCEAKAAEYELVSAETQEKSNSGVFLRTPVRFGKVSCAKDKALCNELDVEEYPTVAHFWGGAPRKRWSIGKKSIKAWVKQRLAAAEAAAKRRLEGDGKGLGLVDAVRNASDTIIGASPDLRSAIKLLVVILIALTSLYRLVRRRRAAKAAEEMPVLAKLPAPEPPSDLVLPASWARERAPIDL